MKSVQTKGTQMIVSYHYYFNIYDRLLSDGLTLHTYIRASDVDLYTFMMGSLIQLYQYTHQDTLYSTYLNRVSRFSQNSK